jgi:glycosyltransferase involved in cell wall biosynthesis
VKRPHVAYWNNLPAPYMIDRFNAVADRGNLQLEAWFSARTDAERSWEVDESAWRFPYRYLHSVGVGKACLQIPAGLVGRHRPDLLVSLYADPSFLLGRVLAAMAGIPTAFWLEATFDAWVPRRPWKELIKKHVLPSVDGILTVGDDGRCQAEQYGVLPDRIFYAPHSIDVAHFMRRSDAARPQRESLRAELGVAGCVFVYVGRLLGSTKGLSDLIDAFASLQRSGSPESSLLLVGDGRDEELLRRRVRDLNLNRVVFTGFRCAADLPGIYAAGDVFIFPTTGDPYGLVLDEAMACGLPLISSSSAGELYLRIDPGSNGLIVPPSDAVALAEAMRTLALDPALRVRMGAASRLKVQGRTPEKWAQDFETAVIEMLNRRMAGRKREQSPK